MQDIKHKARMVQKDIQGVHKVSLQFQEFITKANEQANLWKLLQNEE